MNKGKIFRKLLGQPAPADSSNPTEPPPRSRPSASQNTIYSAGAPIACLARSPDGQRAVIAGSKVFKIIRIHGSKVTEDLDLRAAVTSYGHTYGTPAPADQLNIKAVAWSRKTLDHTIITAGGNGRISVYDLNRGSEGYETARIQEHARQVHSISISPFMDHWLLSASQDGSVRNFDLRVPARNGPVFRTLQLFKCNADAVRCVEWSPKDGMEFACSTDAGMVQQWDLRKTQAPVLKIAAHTTPCFTISWHPDAKHVISGGKDSLCHVWDFSKSAAKNQKAKFTIATPAPVSSVSWRPACWSATAQGRRAAQVTVAYDDTNVNKGRLSTVHLWDLARPTLPFKEIERWDSPPTGLLWNTRDLLWTVDKGGQFTQTDVAFSPKVIDRRSLSTLEFSPNGDVVMLLEERHIPRRARRPVNASEASHSVAPGFNASFSESEEDVSGSFLGPRLRRNHQRRHSGRSMQTLSTTPPGAPGVLEAKVMSLNEAVDVAGPYEPQQVMAIGHAPSAANRKDFKYLTNKYLEPLWNLATNRSDLRLDWQTTDIMAGFAQSADNIGYYRLAQTWRVLEFTMSILLNERAHYHRTMRLQPPAVEKGIEEIFQASTGRGVRSDKDETMSHISEEPQNLASSLHTLAGTIKNEEMESTSNVATPLVRPVVDSNLSRPSEATPLGMIDKDVLVLPPLSVSPHNAQSGKTGTSFSSEQTSSSVEGYDFYGMDSFSPANHTYPIPQRKQPLRLEYQEAPAATSRMTVTRHDSSESFAMFSTAGSSPEVQSLPESEARARSITGDSLRDRVSNWENDFISRSQTTGTASRDMVDESAYDMSSGDSSTILESNKQQFENRPEKLAKEPFFVLPNEDGFEHDANPEEIAEKVSDNPDIIDCDFLPRRNDPEFISSPIDPISLIKETIAFEMNTGVINASAIVLLLCPYLPSTCINRIQANAILRTYHRRLTSMKLFTEAALLRNVCVPLYPDIFTTSQLEVNIAYLCTSCNKPLENDPRIPRSEWNCPQCKARVNGCPICLHRDKDGGDETWWYCPGCAHGGHMSCMTDWHSGPEFEEGSAYSGGCCPVENCLHPCLPGPWRIQRAEEKKVLKAREMEASVRENARQQVNSGLVRRDPMKAGQSRAVEGVRASLMFSGYEQG